MKALKLNANKNTDKINIQDLDILSIIRFFI